MIRKTFTTKPEAIKKPHLKPRLTEDQVRQSRREVDAAYKLYKQVFKRG